MRDCVIGLAVVGAQLAAATAIITAGVIGYEGAAYATPSVTEDNEHWDCRTMGNQICGSTNPQRVPAGRYQDGTLIEPWPVVSLEAVR